MEENKKVYIALVTLSEGLNGNNDVIIYHKVADSREKIYKVIENYLLEQDWYQKQYNKEDFFNDIVTYDLDYYNFYYFDNNCISIEIIESEMV